MPSFPVDVPLLSQCASRFIGFAGIKLSAGFTGTPAEPPTGVRKVAKGAKEAAVREITAVVARATEHPHTPTGIVLTIGALALAIGYMLGHDASLACHSPIIGGVGSILRSPVSVEVGMTSRKPSDWSTCHRIGDNVSRVGQFPNCFMVTASE